jgi:hypothetical protein
MCRNKDRMSVSDLCIHLLMTCCEMLQAFRDLASPSSEESRPFLRNVSKPQSGVNLCRHPKDQYVNL